MKPYYKDDLVTLYHGDATEFPSEFIWAADVLVTDPPYDRHGRDFVSFYVETMPNIAVFGWPEDLVRIALQAKRVPDDWIVWWPTNAGLRSWGPKDQTPRESEHIAIFGTVRQVRGATSSEASRRIAETLEPLGRYNPSQRGDVHLSPEGRRWGDVWRDPSPGLGFQSHLRLHPNEKPLSVMTRLLQVVEEGVVIDPFMGSGTTIVAAKSLGHMAIGIEKDERYCEKAAQRCSQEVLGLLA